ncbi:MAG: DUF5615 family PIN-like protein [Candidatus Nanohaloarchaea archaeon]
MALKLLADENIPNAVVDQLDKTNIDVISVNGLMKGGSDVEVFEKAVEDERAVLTIDKDFVSGLEEEFKHYGIIKFRERYRIGRMVKDVQKVNSTLSSEELNGTIVYLPWGSQ